jgi:hypothetical protein
MVNGSIRGAYWVPAFAGKTYNESALLLKTKQQNNFWVFLDIPLRGNDESGSTGSGNQ